MCFCLSVFGVVPAQINVINVRYNGGLLPDIILLTLCYQHRGTQFIAMKSFCPYGECSDLNIWTTFPPHWVDAQNDQGLDAFMFFFEYCS